MSTLLPKILSDKTLHNLQLTFQPTYTEPERPLLDCFIRASFLFMKFPNRDIMTVVIGSLTPNDKMIWICTVCLCPLKRSLESKEK